MLSRKDGEASQDTQLEMLRRLRASEAVKKYVILSRQSATKDRKLRRLCILNYYIRESSRDAQIGCHPERSEGSPAQGDSSLRSE